MQKSILFCRDPGLTSLVHEHSGSKYLLNARYLGHETILCFGEPGSLGTYFLRQQKSHAVDDSEIPNQTTTRFHQFYHSKKGCVLTTFFSNSIEPGTSDLFQTCHLLTFWCFFLIRGNFHLWKLSPKRCMLHSPRAVFSKKNRRKVSSQIYDFPSGTRMSLVGS